MKNLVEFFGFADARQSILFKKMFGEPKPWTEDAVLRDFRFCNIFREDDKTTVWFRENIRDRLKDNSHVFIATVAFRWFNKIETGEKMLPGLLSGWDREAVEKSLSAQRDTGVPLFTGAYIIKSPNGKKKLEGILDCIDIINSHVSDFHNMESIYDFNLQEVHEWLMKYPYMGPFMAYEVVTDLRHTHILNKAPDINTWASAGPGCARGLGWLVYDNPTRYSYNSAASQKLMLGTMVELLEHSRSTRFWQDYWKPWEMREVEHTLCEYDKWKRGHEGQRLKRRYS